MCLIHHLAIYKYLLFTTVCCFLITGENTRLSDVLWVEIALHEARYMWRYLLLFN